MLTLEVDWRVVESRESQVLRGYVPGRRKPLNADPLGGDSDTVGNVPCTKCVDRLAVRDWAYVYGRRRRGSRAATGEQDRRPLGTDEVSLCSPCARRVFVRTIGDTVMGHPVEALLAGMSLFGVLVGTSYLKPLTELWAWGTLALVFLWLFFFWATRRPRAMCQTLFRQRRKELAAQHGLAARDIQFYEVAD